MAAGLVFVVSARYRAILRQWWLWDDPQLLLTADTTRVWELFFSPAAWRRQSSANFNPIFASMTKVDIRLFGFEPFGFYVHHLVICALTLVAVFFLLRRLIGSAAAAVACVAIPFAPAVITTFSLVMDRHYVEGLLFAACACLLLLRESRAAIIGGAFLYLVAMLEKEFYAPLPLVILAIAIGQKRSVRWTLWRVAACVPPAVIYIVWRLFMLGGIGGYGGGTSGGALRELWGRMFPGTLLGTAIALLIGWLLIRAVLRFGAARPLTIVLCGGGFALLPLAALAHMDDRYAFTATVVLLALAGAAAAAVRRADAWIAFGLLLIVSSLSGTVRSRELHEQLAAMEREGRYLFAAPATDSPRLLRSNGWYLNGIVWLRGRTGGGAAPGFFLSPEGFLFTGADPDARTRRIVTKLAETYRSATLNVGLRRERELLTWQVGPSPDGSSWWFVVLPRYEILPLDGLTGTWRLPNQLRAPSYELDPRFNHFAIVRRNRDRTWSSTPALVFPRNSETRWSGVTPSLSETLSADGELPRSTQRH